MASIDSPTSFQPPSQAIAKVRSGIYYLLGLLAVCIGAAVLYAFHASHPASYVQKLAVPATTADTSWYHRDLQPPSPPPPTPVAAPQPQVTLPTQTQSPPPPPRPPKPEDPNIGRRREAYLRALTSPLVADGWQQMHNSSSRAETSPLSQTLEIPPVTARTAAPIAINNQASISQAAIVTPPQSPYEIKATSMIPTMLLTGIDSDAPGDIVAQVTANVYDSVTHRHLLIPQGTRVQGRVDMQSAFTDRRVQEVWSRLLFPNGTSVQLDGMPGHDQAGYPGMQDIVDNHFPETFGRALLLSAITAGLDIAQVGTSVRRRGFGYGYDTSDIATGAVARELGSVASESIRQGIRRPPTKQIRPGYRFHIMVTRDLVFAGPYQSTLNNDNNWTGGIE